MFLFAKKRLEFVIGLLLLVSILLLCAFGALSYQHMQAYHQAHTQSGLIIDQLRSLNTALSTLQDAEIGQRGYLLTQDPAYLEPYEHALSKKAVNINRMFRAFSTDQQSIDEIKAIYRLQFEKFVELDQTIRALHEQDLSAALEIVRSNSGKQTMDEIRAIVIKIQKIKRDELDKLQIESARRLRDGESAIVAFELVIGIFLTTLYFYLIFDLGDRRRLRLAGATSKNIDKSTGLHNAAYLKKALKNSLKHAARDKTPVALMMLRVESSARASLAKEHRHTANAAIARNLAHVLPVPHIAAQLESGFFAILVYPFRDRTELGAIAARICDVLTLDLIKIMPDRRIDIGVGISIYPDVATNPESLIEKAELALIYPSHRRLGRYNFFQEAHSQSIPRAESLSHGLHQAVTTGDFTLVYQPQVNLVTEEIIGVEALIRWKHPDLGFISPDEFIPLAERTGLILPIGLFVLNRACHDAAEWIGRSMNLRVAINVCALQLYDPDFLSATIRILEESGLPPKCLEIELTERVIMDADVVDVLTKFRALGVHIAVDDFGTGYSSLNYLSKFPADVLKIDRSFIESLPGNDKDSSVVRTIINMGQELGITTIAEGIEKREQALFLMRHGCDIGQGYLFHKPMDAEKLSDLLRSYQKAPH